VEHFFLGVCGALWCAIFLSADESCRNIQLSLNAATVPAAHLM